MEDKIKVLGIEMDCLTAKEAMLRVIQYMDTDSLDTVELVSPGMLLEGQENSFWQQQMDSIRLVLPGSTEVLQAADVTDGSKLKEAESGMFFKMVIKYMQKNRMRVFILASTVSDLESAEETLRQYGRGIRVTGTAVLDPENGREETVINEINGTETDCIFSVLRSPYQEWFVTENRALLKAKLWLGCGDVVRRKNEKKKFSIRIKQFLIKKILRHRAGRNSET